MIKPILIILAILIGLVAIALLLIGLWQIAMTKLDNHRKRKASEQADRINLANILH